MAMFLWFHKNKKVEEKKEEVVTPVATKEETVKPSKENVELKKEGVKAKPKQTKKVVKGKYEVFPVGEKFVYRLRANNGEILATSDLYTTQKGALNAIDNVIKNSAEGGVVDIYQDKHGLWQFKLLALNKRILVVSANYSSQEGCKAASESFKKFAPTAEVKVFEEDTEKSVDIFTLDNLEETKEGGKILLKKQDGDFFFQVVASNGALLCTSIDYKSKSSMEGGLETFKNTISEDLFVCIKDKMGYYQFKMYNNVGVCIAVGESYQSSSRAKSAANSMAAFIKTGEVVSNL